MLQSFHYTRRDNLFGGEPYGTEPSNKTLEVPPNCSWLFDSWDIPEGLRIRTQLSPDPLPGLLVSRFVFQTLPGSSSFSSPREDSSFLVSPSVGVPIGLFFSVTVTYNPSLLLSVSTSFNSSPPSSECCYVEGVDTEGVVTTPFMVRSF